MRGTMQTETRTKTTLPDFNRERINNLSPKDQELFQIFGKGESKVLAPHPIHNYIEDIAQRHPNLIAVSHKGVELNYRELNIYSDYLANTLQFHGVKQGDFVGLYLKRSIEMVIGIFSTLKVGAAYIPQDIGVAPSNILAYVTQISRPKVILTLSKLKHLIPESGDTIILAIDEILSQFKQQQMNSSIITRTQFVISPQAPCFIIFTSGTTGKPNGVIVSHQNVTNLILNAPGNLGIKPGIKVSQILNIAFDMAAWEILGTLTNGGTLHLRENSIQDTVGQVDVVISTPSILSALNMAGCTHLKTVAVAGEPCPRVLADTFATFCDFYNSCGPTETSIVNTMQLHFPEKQNLTIGRPTANNTVYILNEDLTPLPIGEVGEMWAGGICVTQGYLQNLKLTTERYRPDPFLGEGYFMFRTRDLGKWTTEGELIHLGRTDDQVKIRGFRVELDSISGVLESMSEIRRAVTIKYDGQNLISFVASNYLDIEKAKQRIAGQLPYYCIPSHIFRLDSLPITGRGKIDKQLLMQLAQSLLHGENQTFFQQGVSA